MSDKIKACCENCKYYTGKQCDINGNWYDECSLYADDCSQPCEDFEISKEARLKKRIAELEAENARLKDHISQAEKKVDVRKLVKPIAWTSPTEGSVDYIFDFDVYEERGEIYVDLWGDQIDTIEYGDKPPQQAAQEWLEKHVAAACGQGVRNG